VSSILDALRRIEREHETGPIAPFELEPEHSRSRRGWIWSAAAALIIAASGGAAWWLWGGGTLASDPVVIARGPTPAPEGTAAEDGPAALAAQTAVPEDPATPSTKPDVDRNVPPGHDAEDATVVGAREPASSTGETVADAATAPVADGRSDRPAPRAGQAPAPGGETARPVNPPAPTAAATPVIDAVAQRAIVADPPAQPLAEVEPPAQLAARVPLPATRAPDVVSPRPEVGATSDRARQIREQIARRRAAAVAQEQSSGNNQTRQIEETKLRTEQVLPRRAPDTHISAGNKATTAEGQGAGGSRSEAVGGSRSETAGNPRSESAGETRPDEAGGAPSSDEEVSQRRPRGAPYVRVSFLYYSREPSRRHAMLTVNSGELLTVYEGQSVETLNVERILRDEVHFRYEGKLFAVRPRF
jgi:hypothetical protein